MAIRTTRSGIRFKAPFTLKGIDGIQPAGTYAVETDEESIDSNTRVAFRRVATFIHIQRDGASQVVTLDAADLEMLLHDGLLVPLDSVDPATVG
jgi:hypothetical protein